LQFVEGLTTNTQKFSTVEFAEKLADSVGVTVADDGSVDLSLQKWITVGSVNTA
jgi:hypothetical protein